MKVVRYGRIVRTPLVSFPVEVAEDPPDQHCPPAGAIYIFGGSSMQIDGGASFLNNIAENDGGEKRVSKQLLCHPACLRCKSITRVNSYLSLTRSNNIVDFPDRSGTESDNDYVILTNSEEVLAVLSPGAPGSLRIYVVRRYQA